MVVIVIWGLGRGWNVTERIVEGKGSMVQT